MFITLFTVYLSQLEKLSLYQNKIQDITPLSFLPQLQRIDLKRNHIQDITPLSYITKLKRLSLYQNKLQDIMPLKKLLELLQLGFNKISNITSLISLKKLETLRLDNWQLIYPPIWYAYLNHKKGKLGDYIHLHELPQVEKIWQLLKTKDSKNIELARQLALGQGW